MTWTWTRLYCVLVHPTQLIGLPNFAMVKLQIGKRPIVTICLYTRSPSRDFILSRRVSDKRDKMNMEDTYSFACINFNICNKNV